MKVRPDYLESSSYKIPSPLGTAFITISKDDTGPFEVFVNIGKSGSGITSMAEAVGRLMSLVLRMEDGLTGEERTKEIVGQLKDIGSTGITGFGEYRTCSLPDAIAQALAREIGIWEEIGEHRRSNQDFAGPDNGQDAAESWVD